MQESVAPALHELRWRPFSTLEFVISRTTILQVSRFRFRVFRRFRLLQV
jgi:hypothetical protein